MDDGDVVALEVVVDVDLPVAVELPRLALREAEAAVVVRAACRRAARRGSRSATRRCGSRFTNTSSFQTSTWNCGSVHERAVEVLHAVELRRDREAAVERSTSSRDSRTAERDASPPLSRSGRRGGGRRSTSRAARRRCRARRAPARRRSSVVKYCPASRTCSARPASCHVRAEDVAVLLLAARWRRSRSATGAWRRIRVAGRSSA